MNIQAIQEDISNGVFDDNPELAKSVILKLIEYNEVYTKDCARLEDENKRLIAAVKNMRNVKGRNHTELAATALYELIEEK